MKLRYFVLGRDGQLHKASHAAVEEFWEGCSRAEELGGGGENELRLVSVLCDADLLPRKIFLLRVPLTKGAFTPENYLTLRLFSMPDCVTPLEAIQHHGCGWPGDVLRQLAVALDVPLDHLRVPVQVGGPLLTAAALRVTPRQALRYLR